MTCICAVVEEERIYMGGDRALSNQWSILTTAAPKIFQKDGMLLGVCGSVAVLNAVRYRFEPPAHAENWDKWGYMATEFRDALGEALKNGGALQESNGIESFSGRMLVALQGNGLYIVYGGLQSVVCQGYAAIGAGDEVASGALYATAQGPFTPHQRIKRALEAAAAHCPSVAAPFDFLEI